MKNHSIPPHLYKNYPVLQPGEYTEKVVFNDKDCSCVLKVGKQEGHWVAGYDIEICKDNPNGYARSVQPSRKWGEYPTNGAAMEGAIKEILSGLHYHILNYQRFIVNLAPYIYKLQLEEAIIKGKQIELF